MDRDGFANGVKVGATEFHVNRLELEEMESKNMQQQRQQQ